MLNRKPAIISAILTTLILSVGTYLTWSGQINPVDSHIDQKNDKLSTVNHLPGEIINDVALSKDSSGSKVDFKALDQGCFLGKDCIPSIDNPK